MFKDLFNEIEEYKRKERENMSEKEMDKYKVCCGNCQHMNMIDEYYIRN